MKLPLRHIGSSWLATDVPIVPRNCPARLPRDLTRELPDTYGETVASPDGAADRSPANLCKSIWEHVSIKYTPNPRFGVCQSNHCGSIPQCAATTRRRTPFHTTPGLTEPAAAAGGQVCNGWSGIAPKPAASLTRDSSSKYTHARKGWHNLCRRRQPPVQGFKNPRPERSAQASSKNAVMR